MHIGHTTRIAFTGLLVMATLAVSAAGSGALEPGGTFSDDNGSVHESSIEAIADEGITLGCNPPVNDMFCPNKAVTRAQMATFLARALNLPAATGSFADTADSVHAANIGALAAAGITQGCNPPVNDMFCPNKAVTRAQMATFLARALNLPAATGSFADTADSVHAANIGALAAAGITQGCNPPVNDMFCPNKAVTRAQMATFLTRALNLEPIAVPPPLPDASPSPFVVIGLENWLFYDRAVNQGQSSDALIDRTIDELRKVKAIVQRSGRQFVYAIPPNKPVIYSNMVPEDIWQASAAQENSDRLRAALERAADPSWVDLWGVLSGAGEQTYFKHDTHWNEVGSLLAAEQIASRAATGSWSSFGLASTPASQRGDLADLIGIEWITPYEDSFPALAGVEPTVTDTGALIDGRPIIGYTSPSDPAISSVTTAVLHDSFGRHLYNKLGPLFEEVVFLPSFASPIPDAARLYVQESEQIVIEVVERNLPWTLIGVGAAGHLVAALADDFAQTSVPFSRDGTEVVFELGSADPGALRYVIVEARVDSPVIIRSEQVVNIPPSQGAWPPAMYPDTSLYGIEIVGEPTTLRLPLPAAVDVIAAFVVVVE